MFPWFQNEARPKQSDILHTSSGLRGPRLDGSLQDRACAVPADREHTHLTTLLFLPQKFLLDVPLKLWRLTHAETSSTRDTRHCTSLRHMLYSLIWSRYVDNCVHHSAPQPHKRQFKMRSENSAMKQRAVPVRVLTGRRKTRVDAQQISNDFNSHTLLSYTSQQKCV
jgi:hypothetical protein